MLKLLNKELKLTASILSYLFISFGLLAFCPGYPILTVGFFVSFGIFQSFQAGREANDIVYTALLPVAKKDVVKSKYIFSIFIEMCGFLIAAVVTLLRMTVLVTAVPYRTNALMNANFVYLGFLLLIFGCFNAIFICGYFKTAYKFAKSFVAFIITAFSIIIVGEALHFIPGLGAVNAFGFENIGLQLAALAVGIIAYAVMTFLSMQVSIKRFEKIDL